MQILSGNKKKERESIMKRLTKRGTAFICAITLIVGATFGAISYATGADVSPQYTEWSMYSGKGKTFIENGSGGMEVEIREAGIDLPESVKKSDLGLSVTLVIPDDKALASVSKGVVELAQNTCDEQELNWQLSDHELKIGENTVILPLAKAGTIDGESFYLHKTINYFRIYSIEKANGSMATLSSAKLVYVREPGLVFGEEKTADTYLQLSKPLGSTPQSIEASIKMASDGSAEEEKTEWVLQSGFEVDATNGAVDRYGTHTRDKYSINVSKYTLEELAIVFRVYAEKAGVLGTGDNFRLGSQHDLGVAFIHYDYNQIPVEAGWNDIVLPLSQMTNINNGFTLENINCFGFTTYNLAAGDKRIFEDIKLKVIEPIKVTSWMLRPGNENASDSGHTLGAYTTVSGEEPGEGKNCFVIDATSAKIEGLGTINNNFNYDLSKYKMSELAVAFWVYAEKAGTLGTGDNFRLGSGEYKGSSFIHYDYKDIPVEAGWNYIELPLNTWNNIQNGFTLSKISCFGFTTYNLAAGDKRYIGDMQIVLLEDENEKEPSQENGKKVEVTVTENVTTTEKNNMIFSNANAEGEKNTYALFITKDGYPSLLYGTTQFTLTKSVRTGEWIDVAVVKDKDGYISFYLDGALAAKSTVTVSDSLGAPTKKHCIGADGTGNQLMNGTIADVRVWSDERSAAEIKNNLVEKTPGIVGNGIKAKAQGLLGNWFLLGNIEYVLETMPDASSNKNTAVFKGSRADDWIDYKIPESIGKDYWSVVFVPDIQNLIRTGEYNQTWIQMAQWIADNVEKENIQHVISAGDSTWNDTEAEYNRAMQGYSVFNDLVPTNILAGNHDYNWSVAYRDATMYQKYLGEQELLSSAAVNTYAGYFKDSAGKSATENSYYRFSVDGTKWMILQLEFHPRASVLKWAQEILKQYSDDNVILATHSYLDGNGNYASNSYMTYTGDDANAGGSIGDTTEAIWNTYLKDYDNIKMILCGHSHNETGAVVTRMEKNTAGEEVPVLMINAQDMDAWDGMNTSKAYYSDQPIGMLGILRFSADGKNVALQYYAPTFEKSFSPTDPNGKADSNNLKYSFNVETCSHTNTTILINDDKATATTSGYTGDTYCTDCNSMLSNGKVIKATGKKPAGNKDKDVEGNKVNQENTNGEGAQTSDRMQPAVWMVILFVSAMVTLYVAKNRKEGKQ